MNQKGLTLVELITTFALSVVIILILTNVIILIKNIYNNNDIRGELFIEQSTLSKLMNEKFKFGMYESYEMCTDSKFCYIFQFKDETTSKLIVKEDYIKFDKYVYKLKDGSKIKNPSLNIETVDVSDTYLNNSFLIIKIPIENKSYKNEDFGIDLVIQFNNK